MPKKILVVDDEPHIVRVLKSRLMDGGYDVIAASNGESCLQKFKNERPDLIILDIKMPGMNGLEVLDIIRKEEEHKGIKEGLGIPVIMLTCFDAPWMEPSLVKGCNDYINKPYKPEDLFKKIEETLKR